MAKADVRVIEVLRKAIHLLDNSDNYQWGHMGCCNCGFLAQVVTHRSAHEIHAAAMAGRGDWSEQLNDYCPTSGYPMDELISTLLDTGFEREDLVNLERLSEPIILARLTRSNSNLKHNQKEDVLVYLRAWVSLLEEQWAMKQPSILLPGELSRKVEHEAILEGAALVNELKPFLPTFDTAQA